MLFTTPVFALFFVLVFTGYYCLGKKHVVAQNLLLLVASYIFYCWWDWRFGLLLAFSTLLDFFSGKAIAATTRHKKTWLYISIAINLLLLLFFKYCNFFIGSAVAVLSQMGFGVNLPLLHIILPIGISFYTFHGVSYVIDIYKSRIPPTNNLINYGLFVSFFPLLVAGPIERATHLLPQIEKQRSFSYALGVNALRQILWGLFKKLVIADNCAYFANYIFGHQDQLPASSLALGAIFFSFQIYGDFSGYTDIATGVAKLLGFRLLKNFNYPYFSRNIAEFWQRWHISLTSWFRDYVYIPLGGSHCSRASTIRNILLVFLISGFWHGANLTFIVWGMLHALLFIIVTLSGGAKKYRSTPVAHGKALPSITETGQIVSTFSLVTIGWIFFRSPSVTTALLYLKKMFGPGLASVPHLYNMPYAATTLLLVAVFIILEWKGRTSEFAIENMGSGYHVAVRWALYTALIFAIVLFMPSSKNAFIYFRF